MITVSKELDIAIANFFHEILFLIYCTFYTMATRAIFFLLLYDNYAGLNGKSPNFYMYALNNPLIVKDPTGRIPLPVITSVISIGVHLLTTPPSQVTFGSEFIYIAISRVKLRLDHNLLKCILSTFI